MADQLATLAALDGVGSAMAAARDGIDALLRDRGLRRTTPEETAESLLRGAWASARLEGSTATLDELRAGVADPVASASVRLATGLLGLAPTLTRSPSQALARLHTLAARGTVPDEELGRPAGAGAAARLQGLTRLLTAPTSAPALVTAAVVHAELVTAAPFAARSGLVARAAERLVLVGRGVDPTSVTVPEAGHLEAGEGYRAAAAAYARGDQAGVRAWLLHAATAYTSGARQAPLG